MWSELSGNVLFPLLIGSVVLNVLLVVIVAGIVLGFKDVIKLAFSHLPPEYVVKQADTWQQLLLDNDRKWDDIVARLLPVGAGVYRDVHEKMTAESPPPTAG